MCFSQDSGCAGFCRERQHPPDGFPAFEKRLPHAFVPRREKRMRSGRVSRPWKRTKQGDKTAHQAENQDKQGLIAKVL